MAELDPDQVLALSYVGAARRPAVQALWRLDAALGAVLTSGREPLIKQIKLAWWRDALEALDRGPAPAEPVLEAVGREVLPRGVTGAELSAMQEGWNLLLTPDPLREEELRAYAAVRGGVLFAALAAVLGTPGFAGAAAAGEAWALADLARHSGSAADADAALALVRSLPRPRSWPSRLRPIGMMALLAHRDAEIERPRWEEQGAPGRMLRMLRHRLSGS
jgi:phytoene synthase